ncbi:MAG TPA: DUF1858 domain-containing protein [Bryobacteraceae bacterium]|nr:DUF1858 domain-containing protein [Bryobacteraceae bacterium]
MAEPLITREMNLPEILSRYPSCRPVFDRYGLTGCGGELGPREPLWFFARAHRVDEARLIGELDVAARAEAASPGKLEYHPGPADTIYRRFFKAAILTMFTFGCVMGGLNLAVMAGRHQLTSLDLRGVTWAHAHAQVAGWVTFFVMGFAYQAIPRFKFTKLQWPRLACATLYIMAPAVVIRAMGDLFLSNPAWVLAGSIAGAAELAIVVTFATIIVQTIRKSGQPVEPYERFLFAALGWMIVAFAFDLWVFVQSAQLAGDKQWISFISQVDAPWRDMQLAGFAAGMILAVSQRFLPFLYGFREVPARTARVVLWLWNLSVAGNIVFYSLLIRTTDPAWGIAFELSIVGMLVSVLVLVRAFRLFSRRVERDRSLPFLRASFAWAIFALVLVTLMPVYSALRNVAFSHAYFGAYRHAFTVGFISLMIVGVSSKVVPVLCGLEASEVSSLRASFWLINIGNAMRVFSEILTDFYGWAYPVAAVSAWVEVSGLALWAIDLWMAMNRRPSARAPHPISLTLSARVSEVADAYPETVPVFLEFGFQMITNPMMRKTVARSVSLDQACRLHHVDCAKFIAALRDAVARNRAAGGTSEGLVSVP